MQIPYTKLYSIESIRKLDQLAIKDFGITEVQLMENAGLAAYNSLKKYYPNTKNILVVCGGGNNGGDGYVLAKLAHIDGMNVVIWDASEKNTTRELATKVKEAVEALNIPFIFDEEINFIGIDVIVDALCGIGLLGNSLKPYTKNVINKINSSGIPILSIDCPSGLNADTGSIIEIAVRARLTITFLGCKKGLYTGMAPEFCGSIICDTLNLPIAVFEQVNADCIKYTFHDIKALLKPRSRISHKGSNGHLLIIGGDYGFMGAVAMAARAALRTGAGLVSVATRKGHAASITSYSPEVMCHEVEDAIELKILLGKATTLVLGPGLGQSDWSKMMFDTTLQSTLPTVIDADGLNLLASDQKHIHEMNNKYILTPHPGEAARLLGCTVSEIQSDRFSAACEIHKKYGGCIILKGPGSLIYAGDKTILCDYGNPGMGSGGMGDVLSGIIGGLLAQKLDVELSATLGVYIHSYAADIAAKQGERGLIATDLIKHIRHLVNL